MTKGWRLCVISFLAKNYFACSSGQASTGKSRRTRSELIKQLCLCISNNIEPVLVHQNVDAYTDMNIRELQLDSLKFAKRARSFRTCICTEKLPQSRSGVAYQAGTARLFCKLKKGRSLCGPKHSS